MSVFATMGVILAILAGLINFGIGLLRRKHPLMAMMRFGISILSIIAAASIILAKANNVSLSGWGVTESLKYIYLLMGLAIFVGLTLMLPATVERNNLPAEERITPTPASKATPSAATGDGGVRVVKPNDEWVN